MKIKNVFLASLLTKMGVEAKAELVIDDSNGVTLTFPDISEISEIAEGVAIDAPDGTYVVADGDNVMTIVVLSGVVSSLMIETPASAEASTEVGAETEAVLTAIVGEVTALKTKYASVVAELKDLKTSLKHETKEVPAPTADKGKNPQFKVVG
jgi:hypothetical protein